MMSGDFTSTLGGVHTIIKLGEQLFDFPRCFTANRNRLTKICTKVLVQRFFFVVYCCWSCAVSLFWFFLYKNWMKTKIKWKLFALFPYEKNFIVCPFKTFHTKSQNWLLKVVYTLYENHLKIPWIKMFTQFSYSVYEPLLIKQQFQKWIMEVQIQGSGMYIRVFNGYIIVPAKVRGKWPKTVK